MKSPPLRSGTRRSGPVPSGWMAALALPVLLLAAMPVAAQTPHAIPVTLRGNWFAGSCEAPEAMWLPSSSGGRSWPRQAP